MSYEYVEAGSIPNEDIARCVYPYIRVAVWIWIATSVILVALSFKWLEITKLYFYHMMIMATLEMFIPYGIDRKISFHLQLLVGALDFILSYFHWLPSTIIIMFQMIFVTVGRSIFFNETVDSGVIFELFFNMISLALVCWMGHLCITEVGMIYVEADMLRNGNE